MFDIYVDSAANLTEDMILNHNIKVIPFTYTSNGTEKLCFESGVPFSKTAKKFYEDMAQGTEIKTSLVCEANFTEAVTPSLEQGKDVLIITITAGISGTNAQAMKARTALKEKFPDRQIYVADSANASLGEGLIAVYAAKLRESGENIQTCVNWIEDNKYKLNSYVTVNDLKYLRKSGRVSTIAAIAGAILNIKPMLKADSNSPAKLTVYGKERGRRKSDHSHYALQLRRRSVEPCGKTQRTRRERDSYRILRPVHRFARRTRNNSAVLYGKRQTQPFGKFRNELKTETLNLKQAKQKLSVFLREFYSDKSKDIKIVLASLICFCYNVAKKTLIE